MTAWSRAGVASAVASAAVAVVIPHYLSVSGESTDTWSDAPRAPENSHRDSIPPPDFPAARITHEPRTPHPTKPPSGDLETRSCDSRTCIIIRTAP